MSSGNVHVAWIDAWKGALIVLVVLGHVVGMGVHYSSGMTQVVLAFCYKAVYVFHMPAFFLLAGSLWHDAHISLGAFAGKKARRLLLPYFIFGVLSVVIYYVSMRYLHVGFSGATTAAYAGKRCDSLPTMLLSLVHAGGWPNGHGFQANSVLWFLPCLFSLEVVYYVLNRIFPRRLMQLCVAAGALAMSVAINKYVKISLPWGMAFVPYYLFYFIVGRWLNCFDRFYQAVGRHYWICFGVCFLLYVGICLALPDGAVAWYDIRWRMVFSLVTVFGIYVSMALSRRFAASRLLHVLGTNTMAIMLLHKFVVVAAQMKGPLVKDSLLAGGLRAACTVVAITTLATGFSLGCGIALRRLAPFVLGERMRQ